MARCSSTAHRSASTTLANSARIPGNPDDSHVVTPKCGFDERVPMELQSSERTQLVGSHEPAVAGDVGRKDGSEPSLLRVVRDDIQAYRPIARFAVSRCRRHDG